MTFCPCAETCSEGCSDPDIAQNPDASVIPEECSVVCAEIPVPGRRSSVRTPGPRTNPGSLEKWPLGCNLNPQGDPMFTFNLSGVMMLLFLAMSLTGLWGGA